MLKLKLLTLALTVALSLHHAPTPSLTTHQIQEWTKVAKCEAYKTKTGAIRWNYKGPVYSGALGIHNDTWAADAPPGYPRNASLATPREQIEVGIIIDGSYVPDQDGCTSW